MKSVSSGSITSWPSGARSSHAEHRTVHLRTKACDVDGDMIGRGNNLNNGNRAMTKKISTALILATTLLASPAMASGTLKTQTPSPAIGGFKAKDPGAQAITQHCSDVASCNALIAICASNGGTWSESAHNTIGQPTKGACVS
jgi:hypothetical protein